MLIKVTQWEIDRGSKMSPKYCPLAMAICNATKLRMVVVVSYAVTLFYPNNEVPVHIQFPEHVRKWILDYDAGYKCKPFEFELEL